jgi:AraC family transcriptional activator of pobA
MRKKVALFKHASLNDYHLAFKEENTIDNFSVFKTTFTSEEQFEKLFFQYNFRSDFYSIIHILSGSITVTINFETVVMEAGTICIGLPNTIKRLVNATDDCVIEGVSFTLDFFNEVAISSNNIDRIEFFSSQFEYSWKLSADESVVISKYITELGMRLSNKDKYYFGKELLGSTFITILYEIGEMGLNKASIHNFVYGRKEELIQKFAKLVHKNHLTERALSYYADQLHVTPKYLSETAKEITGKTAGQIIVDFNILESKRLLLKTELTISEISFQLHFTNAAFFSKFFKRLTGLSPRAYRASNNLI